MSNVVAFAEPNAELPAADGSEALCTGHYREPILACANLSQPYGGFVKHFSFDGGRTEGL